MIQVTCKSEAYTYNVYHMLKAFFPSEEILMRTEEEASHYLVVQLPEPDRIVVGEGPNRIAVGEGQGRIAIGEGSGRIAIGEGQVRGDRSGSGSARWKERDAKGQTPDSKKELKYRIDICLYEELERLTGHSLAWGILTGVRPTKIAMRKCEEGWARGEFVPWFSEECKVSREKAELSWEIAGREQETLERLDCDEGYSLYVGIPFCPSVCTYCSFSSGALEDWKDRIEDYLGALQRELEFTGEQLAGKRLNTIYIGGGTPTTLTAGQLERLLACIDTSFSRESLSEYTVEAGRPDSVTGEKLQVLKRHKVTRISINPQSMQQKTLDVIGRRHRVEEIGVAFRLARETGFDNINMDLIAGLPGEELPDMQDTLRQVRELAPDSLTVHSLAVKRAAKMEITDLEPDVGKAAHTLSGMIRAAEEAARQMGLLPYYLYRQKNIAGNFENVGYASIGKMGIYNVLMIEEVQDIVACGAGAISKRVHPDGLIERCENVKDVARYIERIGEMMERKRVLFGG